jgi:hypothetical protein
MRRLWPTHPRSCNRTRRGRSRADQRRDDQRDRPVVHVLPRVDGGPDALAYQGDEHYTRSVNASYEVSSRRERSRHEKSPPRDGGSGRAFHAHTVCGRCLRFDPSRVTSLPWSLARAPDPPLARAASDAPSGGPGAQLRGSCGWSSRPLHARTRRRRAAPLLTYPSSIQMLRRIDRRWSASLTAKTMIMNVEFA